MDGVGVVLFTWFIEPLLVVGMCGVLAGAFRHFADGAQ